MKIAIIIIRVLLGLLLTFSSVAYFFNLIPVPELTGAIKTFNDGMVASGYLMPLIKGTELVCGLALMSGFFVPLALVVFCPLAINILLIHLSIAPEGIPVALFVVLSTLFLAYTKKDHYKTLLNYK